MYLQQTESVFVLSFSHSKHSTGQSLREKSYFTGGETEAERGSDLQELMQLLCGEVETRTDTTL